jgi:predicted DNA binding CopG/RHH family protein
MKPDKEEQEILKAYKNGKMTLEKPAEKELKEIRSAAKNTFKKNKRITIRLYDHDYRGIQKKAMERGMPYQTLLSGIIHRYVEGDLVEKNS